jgi:rubrerythrin
MNIFDFALKMELDGEKYYRDLAGKTRYDDLKKVLIGLAEDEKRHYEIIQLAQNQTFKFIKADPSLAKIKNVFADNTEFVGDKKEFIAKLKDEQFDYYQAALVKENQSVELYQKLKESVENPDGRAICEKLIHEEKKHVEVLDNIIKMLNNVNDWVESAEFNHQDNY